MAKDSSAFGAGCWRGTAAARRLFAFWNASCVETVHSNVLNEQYKAGGAAGGAMGADGAAEGKTWADGAAAEQANCIWLSSGETMTLNFSKSQCPE